MTIDEALEQIEEIAEDNQKVVDTHRISDELTIEEIYCDDTEIIEERLAVIQKRADDFRQLAEWLNELKHLRKQTGWIPVSERVAEFPCLACDIFEQIFIPCGIVVLDSRCYEGKDFAFNVEKFLRGKEVILCGGEKVYEKPREIVAWMPLPEPYKEESEGEE